MEIQQEAVDSILSEVKPARVSLSYGEVPRSHATGTIISPVFGLVLTCAHIPVPAGGDIGVWTVDGNKVAARVLGKTSQDGEWGNDLALTQLPGPWPFVTVGTVDEVTPNDPVGPPRSLDAAGMPVGGLPLLR